jgi:hypothetical protein
MNSRARPLSRPHLNGGGPGSSCANTIVSLHDDFRKPNLTPGRGDRCNPGIAGRAQADRRGAVRLHEPARSNYCLAINNPDGVITTRSQQTTARGAVVHVCSVHMYIQNLFQVPCVQCGLRIARPGAGAGATCCASGWLLAGPDGTKAWRAWPPGRVWCGAINEWHVNVLVPRCRYEGIPYG